MGIEEITSELAEAYTSFLSTLPPSFETFINLFLLVLLLVVYSVFIWKLYRFIGTKNLFHFNLSKYNTADHPVLAKVFATLLYLVEYILLVPFLIFVWFAVFTIFLIFLAKDLTISTILILSVSIIAAIRVTSYIPRYGEELSREIAKLLPFTLLAISLLNPGFFNFERIITQFGHLGGFFNVILNYLIFIVVLEVILRFFDFLFTITGLQQEPEEEPVEEEPKKEEPKKEEKAK